jgi:branched-subunit amino acid ABC-type transport system permease component
MALAEPGELIFFLSVLIEGVLARSVYALIALAFVLVYKSSRMINFAVGEWLMAGALTAGAGYYALKLGPLGALLFAVLDIAVGTVEMIPVAAPDHPLVLAGGNAPGAITSSLC